jgi:outer membrane protein TolC
LREVEDDLVAYRTDQITADDTATSAQSAGFSLYLSNNRYAHGLADYLTVLDAERSLVSAKQQLVQADAELAVDVVNLFTALGGGWQSSAAGADVTAGLSVKALRGGILGLR